MVFRDAIVSLEVPGPISGMSSFQDSYYYGGIWLIFLLLALAGLGFVIYDSQKRQLTVPGWRIGAVVMLLLVLPTMLFRFSVTPKEVSRYYELQEQVWDAEHYMEGDWVQIVDDATEEMRSLPMMTGSMELVLYLGVLGGIGGVALAAAYYMMYKDSLPETVQPYVPVTPGIYPPVPRVDPPPTPNRPKTQAWLTGQSGQNYQLCQGETTIGRSSRNDIQIAGDSTVSKSHAKIIEQNGHFKFYDLGATNGSRVNGRVVRQPILLQSNDEIQLGDNTKLRFVSGLG